MASYAWHRGMAGVPTARRCLVVCEAAIVTQKIVLGVIWLANGHHIGGANIGMDYVLGVQGAQPRDYLDE
jgi:hypothetical protein